jgi:hypothetical protein
MTGILMWPAIAVPHRRYSAFDNGTDPDSGEFPSNPAHTQSDLRSKAIRNAADGPPSRPLMERTALKSLSADADS